MNPRRFGPTGEEPPLPEPPHGDGYGGSEIEESGYWAGSADRLDPLQEPEHAGTFPGTRSKEANLEPQGQYRVAPRDLAAERAVLGSILIDRDAIVEIADILAPDDFYRQGHALMFGAMRTLHRSGQPVDVVTVAAELDRVGDLGVAGGTSYLSSLANETPTAVHVGQYAQIVADTSQGRRLIEAAGKIAELGYARDPDAVSRAAEILRGTTACGSMPAANVMARSGARCLSEVSTAPPPAPLLGHLDPQGHTILHGMGGVGKGTLAAWWIVDLVAAGHRVLVVDYEGHPEEWARRIYGLGGAQAVEAVLYVSPSSAGWTGRRGAIWDQAADLHALAVAWGATYMVVDSIVPACGGTDPLKPEAAGQYAAALIGIGLPTLSLAHVTKADSPAYPFGSIFWHNLARMSWSLTRDGETVQLVSRKANNYDHLGRFVVTTTWFEGRLGEVDLTPYSVVLADRIAETIAPDPLTVAEIVDRLNADEDEGGVKAGSVRTALRRGLKANRFTIADDRWGLS
jgi:hypothetical protein